MQEHLGVMPKTVLEPLDPAAVSQLTVFFLDDTVGMPAESFSQDIGSLSIMNRFEIADLRGISSAYASLCNDRPNPTAGDRPIKARWALMFLGAKGTIMLTAYLDRHGQNGVING